MRMVQIGSARLRHWLIEVNTISVPLLFFLSSSSPAQQSRWRLRRVTLRCFLLSGAACFFLASCKSIVIHHDEW